jgi:chaperonin cofactor prefoldin
MLDTYQQIQVERIQAQIMAYQWVQDRLQDLVTSNDNINSEIRETRTRI